MCCMSLRAVYQKYTLHFKFDAGTSRGILREKDTYFVRITDEKKPSFFGLGECGPLKGLSMDDRTDFEIQLSEICDAFSTIDGKRYAWDVSAIVHELVGNAFPAIQFGFETALLDWINGGFRTLFQTPFSHGERGIPINGLIWMGDESFMRQQIDEKLRAGYNCLKLKIGAIDFDRECRLLEYIRHRFPAEQITLRVDANGAFSPDEAPEKLRALARYALHSIEQPIRAGQWEAIARLCRQTPLPIALDEELIGVMDYEEKAQLLYYIQPQYIILKPTLLGGFEHCREWIALAQSRGIGWWMTSALESNVGLNAISQFTAGFPNPLPQGLGTGQLYTNNVESPLVIEKGVLHLRPAKGWNLRPISGLLQE